MIKNIFDYDLNSIENNTNIETLIILKNNFYQLDLSKLVNLKFLYIKEYYTSLLPITDTLKFVILNDTRMILDRVANYRLNHISPSLSEENNHSVLKNDRMTCYGEWGSCNRYVYISKDMEQTYVDLSYEIFKFNDGSKNHGCAYKNVHEVVIRNDHYKPLHYLPKNFKLTYLSQNFLKIENY